MTELVLIKLEALKASDNPRGEKPGRADDLYSSIAAVGLRTPLDITISDGAEGWERYEVINGGRRLAALKRLRRTKSKCR